MLVTRSQNYLRSEMSRMFGHLFQNLGWYYTNQFNEIVKIGVRPAICDFSGLGCPTWTKMPSMIRREQIEELLKMPVDERRRVLQLLQASLAGDKIETPFVNGGQTSPAAKWLLSMAGRYSGGPGNTAARADEILRAEIGKKPGLKN